MFAEAEPHQIPPTRVLRIIDERRDRNGGDADHFRKFQDSFGAFGDEFITSELEAVSFEPDDVTFTNDDRTAAQIGSGSSALKIAKEDGEWKICDPDIDFSAFDDFGDMVDIFDDFGDFSDMFDDFSNILDEYDVW